MQLEITRDELKEATQGLGRLIGGRQTLPVLGAVRFEADNQGQVTATGTDLESAATFRFSQARCDGAGVFIMGLEHLKPLAKGRGNDSVVFEPEGPERVGVTVMAGGQSLKRSLPVFEQEEWPMGVMTPATETTTVPGFLDTYRMLAPFASRDETRHTINSVFLDVSDKAQDGAVMLATDGKRLASRNHMSLPLKESCVLRVSKFLTWSRLPADADIGTCQTGTEKEPLKWFVANAGPWHFATRTIDATYPNWRQVVPQPGPNRIELTDADIGTLIGALPSLPGIDYISVICRDGKVSVWAKDADNPDWTVIELPAARFEGEAVAGTALDRNYVLDALKAGLMRTLRFSDDLSPVLSESGDGGTHVLMPVRSGMPDEIVQAIAALHEEKAADETAPEAAEPETVTDQKPSPEPETSPAPRRNPKEGEAHMPEDKQVKQEGTALDRAVQAYDQARTAVREANAQLGTLATELKNAIREQKAQATDLEKARGTLSKLQAISL